MADQTCNFCVEDAWIEISHDAGTTMFELPAIKSAVSSFTERNATEVRHSNSGKAFVKPCGGDARTKIWTITHYPCLGEPMRLFLRNNDTVLVRIHAGKDTIQTGIFWQFDAKFVEGPQTLDNSTDDNAEDTFTFEDVTNQVDPQVWDGNTATPGFITPTTVVNNANAQPYLP